MHNEWVVLATKYPGIQSTKNQVLNPVVADLAEARAGGKRLFDYGCGWGEFSMLMHSLGYDVTAFDDADEMLARAKQFIGPHFITKAEFEARLPTLQGTFDVAVSNLVLCILDIEEQHLLLSRMKQLVTQHGLLIISFCHPRYDSLPDSLVSKRFVSAESRYEDTFQYEKEIKENGARFHDYHRPLEYYQSLFESNNLSVLEVRESDTLGSDYPPDFIVFALRSA